jgi:hypothetical protein
MNHHVEALSIDKLLARMVKMELRELVAMIADGDKASRRIVHHNGVTVIDDGERRSTVVELDRRQVGLFCGGCLSVTDGGPYTRNKQDQASPISRGHPCRRMPDAHDVRSPRNDSHEAEERCRCYESSEHRFHREFSLGQQRFCSKLPSTKR